MANELSIPNQVGSSSSGGPVAAFNAQSLVNSSWITDLSTGYTSGVRGPGLVVSSNGTADKRIAYTAGQCVIGASAFNIAAGTIALTDADASNPRIDVAYVTSAGVVAVSPGIPAATPLEPSTPAGGLKLSAVWVVAGGGSTFTVAAGHVYSRRIEMPMAAVQSMAPSLGGVGSYIPLVGGDGSQSTNYAYMNTGYIYYTRFTPARLWPAGSWSLGMVMQSSGASINMRAGVYAATWDGKPGSLLENFGNTAVASGTTYGLKFWGASSTSLIPGYAYYSAVAFSADGVQTVISYMDNGPATTSELWGNSSATFIRSSFTYASGNLPSTSPTASVVNGGYMKMALKVLV